MKENVRNTYQNSPNHPYSFSCINAEQEQACEESGKFEPGKRSGAAQ